jgi:hypothetical protein
VRSLALEILQIQAFWMTRWTEKQFIQPLVGLFDRFTKDPHPRVRQVALRALSRWNRKRVMDAKQSSKNDQAVPDEFSFVRMEVLYLTW